MRGVPRITNKKTIQVQKDRVLRGLGTDARATGGGEGLAGIGARGVCNTVGGGLVCPAGQEGQ